MSEIFTVQPTGTTWSWIAIRRVEARGVTRQPGRAGAEAWSAEILAELETFHRIAPDVVHEAHCLTSVKNYNVPHAYARSAERCAQFILDSYADCLLVEIGSRLESVDNVSNDR